jgi:ribonuclease P protein subunit POP4
VIVITAGNILIHEFIGLEAEVVRCSDRKAQGASGVVVDETRNTLVLESRGRERRFAKKACVFRFTLPDGGSALVRGETVAIDPVERPKKLAQHCKVV